MARALSFLSNWCELSLNVSSKECGEKDEFRVGPSPDEPPPNGGPDERRCALGGGCEPGSPSARPQGSWEALHALHEKAPPALYFRRTNAVCSRFEAGNASSAVQPDFSKISRRRSGL
jgi:hypothetical protein